MLIKAKYNDNIITNCGKIHVTSNMRKSDIFLANFIQGPKIL